MVDGLVIPSLSRPRAETAGEAKPLERGKGRRSVIVVKILTCENAKSDRQPRYCGGGGGGKGREGGEGEGEGGGGR